MNTEHRKAVLSLGSLGSQLVPYPWLRQIREIGRIASRSATAQQAPLRDLHDNCGWKGYDLLMPGAAKDRFDQQRRKARRIRRGDHYRRGLRHLAVAGWKTTKEHNVGSLVRTAHAAAAREVLLVGDQEWNVPAAKTAQDFTDIHFLEDQEDFLCYLAQQKYSLVAVELDPRAVSLFDAEYPENPCFLLGAERLGIPAGLLDAAELIVQIPQWGLIPCLNLAVAGSIVLYDYLAKEARAGRLDRPDGGLVLEEDEK